MSDLRERLEREGARITRSPDFADRMFERGRRRERHRKAAALAVGVVLFVAILLLVSAALPGGDRGSVPVTPGPSPGTVAGTYVGTLPSDDADVARLGMEGEYVMGLRATGVMTLSAPKSFDLPGSAITFEIDEDRLTTDLFVGERCAGVGVYRWTLQEGTLVLDPVDDACETRRILLSTLAWAQRTDVPPADVLQGDWTTTFTCEQMIQAVRRSPVDDESYAFWASARSQELGGGDPDAPCIDAPESLAYTFRFDAGRLLVFDAAQVEGFDGTYRITGGRVVFRDGATRNIVGSYEAAFEIDGDTVTFDLLGRAGSDPFYVSVWESAPFVRQAST